MTKSPWYQFQTGRPDSLQLRGLEKRVTGRFCGVQFVFPAHARKQHGGVGSDDREGSQATKHPPPWSFAGWCNRTYETSMNGSINRIVNKKRAVERTTCDSTVTLRQRNKTTKYPIVFLKSPPPPGWKSRYKGGGGSYFFSPGVFCSTLNFSCFKDAAEPPGLTKSRAGKCKMEGSVEWCFCVLTGVKLRLSRTLRDLRFFSRRKTKSSADASTPKKCIGHLLHVRLQEIVTLLEHRVSCA